MFFLFYLNVKKEELNLLLGAAVQCSAQRTIWGFIIKLYARDKANKQHAFEGSSSNEAERLRQKEVKWNEVNRIEAKWSGEAQMWGSDIVDSIADAQSQSKHKIRVGVQWATLSLLPRGGGRWSVAAHEWHAGVWHELLVALVLGAEHLEQQALLVEHAVGEEALRGHRKAHGAHRVREHHLRADRPHVPAYTGRAEWRGTTSHYCTLQLITRTTEWSTTVVYWVRDTRIRELRRNTCIRRVTTERIHSCSDERVVLSTSPLQRVGEASGRC